MPDNADKAIIALDRRFLIEHTSQAARRIEKMSSKQAAVILSQHPATLMAPVFSQLAADVAVKILGRAPDSVAADMLAELSPNDAARLMAAMSDGQREHYLKQLHPEIAQEITRMLDFPADSAGRLMDTRIRYFRSDATVAATLDRLRQSRAKATRSLFLIDADNRLSGRVGIQDLAVAEPNTLLQELALPVSATVTAITPRDEVVELLETHNLVDLPVVDIDGRMLGIIYHSKLIHTVQEDATVDIQTMVGASKDERALSTPMFAVRRRLPWLQVNLLTAFLAASVVGLFEETITQFTALAVLLPVVAGQSGNAGAQALAVTMRGLALREISLRHWLQVTLKEVQTGLVNGLAIAATCGLGVYFWSGSMGLVAVIAMSMVLAMVAAGIAGAIVPIVLTRIGQDPAQSSSIILTTVTDVAGFFSFLGIATLLSGML